MPFYIKKSVKPIEARELLSSIESQEEIIEWCYGKKGTDGSIYLKTPESNGETQLAVTGDFILKGYTEELGWHFWPVKPSYFNENYQLV